MKDNLTQYRALLRKYNCIGLGDRGFQKAHEEFLGKLNIVRKRPTQAQIETMNEIARLRGV